MGGGRIALRPAAFLAIALIAVARLALAWADLATLAAKTLPDDAFYYFRIAQHLAAGDGVTFDGLSQTNGFHPLWLAAITPFFAAFPGDAETPVHLSLTLATLLSLAALPFVYAIVEELTENANAAALAALLYAANPFVAMETLNGLESVLANLLFAATTWYAVCRGRAGSPHGGVDWKLGVLAGLAILARTDNVFLFAAILLAALSERRAGIARIVAVGSVGALVASPWVLWSAVATGSPIQSSGLAIPFVLAGNIDPAAGTDSLRQWQLAQTLDGFRLALRYSGTPWPPLTFVLVGGALILALRSGSAALGARFRRLNFLIVALLGLLLFHGVYRMYPRSWYFVPVGFVAVLYLGVVFDDFSARRRGHARLAVVATVLALVGWNLLQLGSMWHAGWYPWQLEMVSAARWVGANTGAGDRVGAFNAGIVGYWNPDRTVINLDGVVNSDAFDAIRRRRLSEYISAAGIAYLIDYEAYFFAPPEEFSATYAPYFGEPFASRVNRIATIPGTLGGSDIVALKVR